MSPFNCFQGLPLSGWSNHLLAVVCLFTRTGNMLYFSKTGCKIKYRVSLGAQLAQQQRVSEEWDRTKVQSSSAPIQAQALQLGHCVVDNTSWQDIPQLNCIKLHYLWFWISCCQTNLVSLGRNQGFVILLLAWRVPVYFSWSLSANSSHTCSCILSCSIMTFCYVRPKNAGNIPNRTNWHNGKMMFYWLCFLSSYLICLLVYDWALKNIIPQLSLVAPNLVWVWMVRNPMPRKWEKFTLDLHLLVTLLLGWLILWCPYTCLSKAYSSHRNHLLTCIIWTNCWKK